MRRGAGGRGRAARPAARSLPLQLLAGALSPDSWASAALVSAASRAAAGDHSSRRRRLHPRPPSGRSRGARGPSPRTRRPRCAGRRRGRKMAWVLKMDEVIESGLVHDFDSSLSGIGQELGAGAYSMSDVLALPIFKQEDSSLSLDGEAKHPPFQYVMCAATSPAVKLHDETLTYLNQGQSYEIRMLDNRKMGDMPEISGKLVKSIIRVVFHDRRLQYTEHQQLEGWKWNRPGDRLLDLGTGGCQRPWR